LIFCCMIKELLPKLRLIKCYREKLLPLLFGEIHMVHDVAKMCLFLVLLLVFLLGFLLLLWFLLAFGVHIISANILKKVKSIDPFACSQVCSSVSRRSCCLPKLESRTLHEGPTRRSLACWKACLSRWGS